MKISKSFRKSQARTIQAAINGIRESYSFPGLRSVRIRSTKNKVLQGWAEVPKKGKAIIFINRSLASGELYQVVVHEMVHVSQYLRGDLKSLEDGFIWKGKAYHLPFDLGNMNFADYVNLPWELEAYVIGAYYERLFCQGV